MSTIQRQSEIPRSVGNIIRQNMRPDVITPLLLYYFLCRLIIFYHFCFNECPILGATSPSPLPSLSENVMHHSRRQHMGKAHPVTRTEDLPSPLFENWKSARSLWKCYLLTIQCLLGPIEQQKQAFLCWQTAINGQYMQDDWLRAGTKFVRMFIFYFFIFC